MIALLTWPTMLAVPVVVASMGCAREKSLSHSDADSFRGLNQLPRRNHMRRPWSSELVLDLNGAMRVCQTELTKVHDRELDRKARTADLQVSALILPQDSLFAR